MGTGRTKREETASDTSARVVILRAGSGTRVWSSGHDVRELPEDGRDPLAYNAPLEHLLRRVQDFPAPILAMLEGSADLLLRGQNSMTSRPRVPPASSRRCASPARSGG